MKMIQEYIIKVIIIIFIFSIALEICSFFLIYNDSKKIYDRTFNDTLIKSTKKSKEAMESLTHFISNLFMSYMTKLKLISKHTYLFNGKMDSNEENIINRNSKFFKNKNLRDKIIEAKTESIYEKEAFKALFNETTEKFDFVGYYLKKYGKDIDRNILLKKLLKEHDELNYIGYYNTMGEEFDINNFEDEEIQKLNYLLPIFKSIYLERLIAKRDKMDILRITILTEKELIIYPPEDPFKINLYNIIDMNYMYCNWELPEDYYFCLLGILNPYWVDNDLFFIQDSEDYNNIIYSVCIKYTYSKGNYQDSILCFEVNFGYLINNIDFLKTKFSDFGLLTTTIVYDFEYPVDLYVIYNTNRKKLSELREVYNNSESTPESLVLNDGQYEYYSLYYDLYFETTKVLKENPELNINITDLEKEYENIRVAIFDSLFFRTEEINEFQLTLNKTTCRKKLLANDYECFKGEFEMSIIIQFNIELSKINEDIVDIDQNQNMSYELITYSILETLPDIKAEDMKALIKVKLERTILFYVFMLFILFCIYLLFINILSNYFFSSIDNLTDDISKIKVNQKTGKIILHKNNNSFYANKEMLILYNIYELLNKSVTITEIFENENFLKKYKLELLDNIGDKNIKDLCNSLFGILHFKNKQFHLAEKELKTTINYFKEIEKKLKTKGIGEYDKIKEAIKRSSMVPYLNDYSNFENIDENLLDIIYLNIYKQRFIYLYAMTKYKLANEVMNDNNNALSINKDRIKRKKELRNTHLDEAIKYFSECIKINKSFGINQIKIIYSLIMISRCYMSIKEYKNSINNINEALRLFYDFSKKFNHNHSMKYNPKVMLFVEANIFQYIIFTISNICTTFHKTSAANWIIFKLFNTSPFLLSNVHYPAGIILLNFLNKSKINMRRYDKNFLQNENMMKEYNKIKKKLTKTISRMYIKNMSNKNFIAITKGENTKSLNNQTIKDNATSYKYSSNMNASRYQSIYTVKKYKSLKKNINICITENIFGKINWEEFKDVIIKYLNKYFTTNEEDTFSYIQFGKNGLKTKLFLSQPLIQFISKLNKVKNNNELNNNYIIKNDSEIILGMFDIFETIISNYQKTGEADNIIIIFINAKDIRFASVSDCLNIVETLNDNNTSVFFFCFDEIIEKQKINNIQSFLNGLVEGYFFQIKNYQQLKEIFVNLSTMKYQTNFFRYDYDFFNNFL